MVSGEDERAAFADAETLLRGSHGRVFIADEQGTRVEVPETAVRLVHQVVQALARGNPVAVTALPKELTIQHAAELLDVRPQDVVRLIDQGEIPVVQSGDLA